MVFCKILKSAISNNVPECVDKVDWLLENNEFLHIEDDKVGLKYYYDIEMQIYNLLLEKSKKQTDINISDEKLSKQSNMQKKNKDLSMSLSN